MATEGKITYYFKILIGKNYVSFSTEGDNLHEAIMASKKISFDGIKECGMCRSTNLELSAHVTPKEKHEYTYVRCMDCKATLNFGQRKDDKNMFYLRTEEIMEGQYKGQKAYAWKPYVHNQQYNEQQ